MNGRSKASAVRSLGPVFFCFAPKVRAALRKKAPTSAPGADHGWDQILAIHFSSVINLAGSVS